MRSLASRTIRSTSSVQVGKSVITPATWPLGSTEIVFEGVPSGRWIVGYDRLGSVLEVDVPASGARVTLPR